MIDECKLEVKDAIEINLVLYVNFFFPSLSLYYSYIVFFFPFQLDLVNSRALHPKQFR